MSRLVKHLALVSETDAIASADVMTVASALQKQATRDLAPIWEIDATIDAFGRLEDVPLDYWPMIIRDDIEHPGAAGIHLDDNNQPYALISASGSRDVWSLTASHEALEMLVDPFGNRLVAGDSPMPEQGRVNFLVEVCDPSEDASFAYSVNSVLVSDFYTPQFFDPIAASGIRYSFTSAIKTPRSVLKGGYLSWVDPQTNEWWQQTWFRGDGPGFRNVGKLSSKGSLRSQIDAISGRETAAAIGQGREAALMAGRSADLSYAGTAARAEFLRGQIAEVLAGA